MQNPDSVKITIVAYDGVQMAAVLGLTDLFEIASDCSQQYHGRQFHIQTLQAADTDTDIGKQTCDVLILPPNLSGVRGEGDTELHGWIKYQHNAGALTTSVCAGAFWLGHSGLLDNRPATTHWMLEEEIEEAFPQVNFNTESLLVDDGDVVTAGGVMAWLDLGLFITGRFLGGQVVSDTAKRLLIDPGGREQKNYRSFRPASSVADPAIGRVQKWLETEFSKEIPVNLMAQTAGLTERTFQRRFKMETGLSANAYLQALRIEKARGLLELTGIPISNIGWNVGYQDTSAFSRVFKNTTGLSAGEYRKRFGVIARRKKIS
jgi:transcriptional regulator GlxA family with amidase domain